MRISYKPAGFNVPDPRLQPGDRSLVFTRAHLVHSAVTVGRRDMTDVLQHGDLALVEIIWRTAMLLACVQERTDESLEWTPVYAGLDPSERGAVSYFVGMTFAKLMSEHLLDVPWLMHLDVYWDDLAPTFQAGEERPDLVGHTVGGDWIAVESKGGAGNLKTVGWDRAKDQLANLRTVNGTPIHQRVAAVTFQRRRVRSPGLHVEFRDPPAGREGFDLPVSAERFVSAYYKRILRIIGAEYTPVPRVRSASGSRCLGRYIPEVDYWIGVAEEIVRAPDPYRPAMAYAEAAVAEPDHGPPRAEAELARVGSDGVAVVLGPSWDQRFRSPAPGEERSG